MRFIFGWCVAAASLLLSSSDAFAQMARCIKSYSAEADHSALGFAPSDVETLVIRVAASIGLGANGVRVIPCDDIDKVQSWYSDGSAVTLGEYIVYQPSWVREVVGSKIDDEQHARTRDEAVVLFGHELGHLLMRHFTSNRDTPRVKKELEADQFAGCAAAQMQVSWDRVEDLLSRLREDVESIYPSRAHSLEVAKIGYDHCARTSPQIATPKTAKDLIRLRFVNKKHWSGESFPEQAFRVPEKMVVNSADAIDTLSAYPSVSFQGSTLELHTDFQEGNQNLRMYFSEFSLEDSDLLLGDHDITIITNKLVLSGASIRAFPSNEMSVLDADRAGSTGRSGKPGGSLTIYVLQKRIIENTVVDLSGQDGGAGGNGANGQNGASAPNGGHCENNVATGYDGEDGGVGVDGGDGGEGGNGGYLEIVVLSGMEKVPEQNIAFKALGGHAGAAGKGGVGGQGGEGGVALIGRLSGDIECNIFKRGVDGHMGIPGADGAQAADGRNGRLSLSVADLGEFPF